MRTPVHARRREGGRPHSHPASAVADPDKGRYVLNGWPAVAPPLACGLHVVATPIGNLRDITLRALELLAAADVIACEDTRITRRLLDHYGISTTLIAYHDHNAAAVRPQLLRRLAEGAAIALVSDAGTPLVSDPGFKLVRAAHEAEIAVSTAPGPSAVLAALTVSGLPTDRFFFEGFLPSRSAQRSARIAALKTVPATLVLFETGRRVAAALNDLAAGMGDREAVICRELTKLHEELRRGDLPALASQYGGEAEIRGEFVIVIAPPPDEPGMRPVDLDALLREALNRLSVKEAVAEVAAVTGGARREVYQRALALAKEKPR